MTDGESLVIRSATVADAAAIAEVNAAAGREGWADFLPPEVLERFEPPVEAWRRRLAAARPGEVLVAVEHDDVVGVVSTRASADGEPPQLGALFTHPCTWGRGVGRALLAHAVEALRERGCGEVVLWTETRNHRPRAFYEAGGWRHDGATREREFLGHPIVEVRYRLALRAARAS